MATTWLWNIMSIRVLTRIDSHEAPSSLKSFPAALSTLVCVCVCVGVCSRQGHKIITLRFCDSNESHLHNWSTILCMNWWKTLHPMMHYDIFQVGNGIIIHVWYPESVCHGDYRPPVTFWVASKHILNCLIVDKWCQFVGNLFHVYLLWSWKRNMGLVCMMQWHSSAKKIICKVRRWILTTAHSHPI